MSLLAWIRVVRYSSNVIIRNVYSIYSKFMSDFSFLVKVNID